VLLLPLAGGFVADLRKEGGHARQTLLRPRIGPLPHERQGRGASEAFGRLVLHGAIEVDGADAEVASARCEHLPDELVIRLVGGDRLADPVVIGLGGIGPEIDGEFRFDAQNVAPFHRPVVGEFPPLQQTIDQRTPLPLRVRVVDERPGLVCRGQRADHIQIGATDKHGVRAEDGLNAQ